jgi:hypothetical protein
MKRRILEIVLLCGVLFTSAWVIRSPGYDSVFSFLGAIAALLSIEFPHPEESLLYRAVQTARLNVRRLGRAVPLPEATLTFTTLESGTPVEHRVRAVRLFADGASTHLFWLIHDYSGQSAVIDTIDGHHPELFAVDFDGDNFPEVALRFSCGGHSRGFRLYRLEKQCLSLVPGSDVGSDWPEILWEDRDHDGRLEIYTKNINWQNRDEDGPVTRFVLCSGKYLES